MPRIGRPAYRVTKQYDKAARQKSLLFQIEYPEIDTTPVPAVGAAGGVQAAPVLRGPRHRYMSSFEQRREAVDPRYQYLLFAAEPYEVIGFKIPNWDMDRAEGSAYSHWDADEKVYTLRLTYRANASMKARENNFHDHRRQRPMPPPPPPPFGHMQRQMPPPPPHMMMQQQQQQVPPPPGFAPPGGRPPPPPFPPPP